MRAQLSTRHAAPVAFWVCAGMWAGVVAGEAVHWGAGARGDALVVAASSVACACLVAASRRRRLWRVGLAAAVGFVLGAAGTASYLSGWEGRCDHAGSAGARRWVGVVVTDADEGRFGAVTTVRVRGGPFDGYLIRLGLPPGAVEPDVGRIVAFKAIVKPPVDPGDARDQARRGVVGFARPWAYEVS